VKREFYASVYENLVEKEMRNMPPILKAWVFVCF